MKTSVLYHPMANHTAKRMGLLFAMFLSFYFLHAQDTWAQPEYDSSSSTTEAFMGSNEADEEEEAFGLFIFQFGNGMIATLDEASARDIGNRVGVSNPIRGINKTGDYYAELLRIGMLEAASNGGASSMQPILLRGFLAPNGKVYKSKPQYESQPYKPLVDPAVYGRYKAELGGQPKVFTL